MVLPTTKTSTPNHHVRSQLRYTPFAVDLHEVTETHMADLREVAEGWYVEYKSEVPKPRELAKSLSSFANRYGGWLFLGIQENPEDNTAAAFPGIPEGDVTSALQQLRDAAKDLLQPTVPFFHNILRGPLAEISLPSGHSIVIVRIPEGASTPYVHNDGRVYVRTGDSSSPVSATDRTTLDLLHRKAQAKTSLLEDLIDRSPVVSKGEEDTTYLHLALCSDPFQVLGHRYGGSFTDFSTAMRAPPLPFDNIYTSQDGFVARQVRGNERHKRLFTWEFSRTCNSFVTLPLSTLKVPLSDPDGSFYNSGEWSQYHHGERFASLLAQKDLRFARVLNLNLVVAVIGGIIARHRSLAGLAGVRGPFYVKTKIENTWRVIPFIDTSEYISHIEAFDVPVVQDSNLTAPLGGWPEGFITEPEVNQVFSEDEQVVNESAIATWIAIMQALGIPGEVLGKSGNEILSVAVREAERHRNRLAD